MSNDKKSDIKKGLNQLFNALLEEEEQEQAKYKVNAASNQSVKEYNYYLRDSILTPKEQAFYEVLLKITNAEKHCILSQVSLIEIFQPTRDNYWGSKGKIQHLHIDFLLCRKRDLHPILAIELDDKSHQKAKRSARDEFLDALFANFKLNLLHVPAADSYHPKQLASMITKAIQQK